MSNHLDKFRDSIIPFQYIITEIQVFVYKFINYRIQEFVNLLVLLIYFMKCYMETIDFIGFFHETVIDNDILRDNNHFIYYYR